MAPKGRLICECGGTFAEKASVIDGVPTDALVCGACGYTMMTREQAIFVTRVRLLQARLSKPRKVVRVGNSVGVTLPDDFAKLGQRVRMVVKGEHTLEITVQ